MTGKRAWLWSLAVAVTVLAVYLCFPTKNYYWDGIFFSQTIENASGLNQTLLHPNHLTYELLGYGLYRIVLEFGISVRALTVLQIANSVFSAVAAGIFFFILRGSLRSTTLAFWLTLLFSFSATWWKYSTDADTYILSVLFMLISFGLVLPGRIGRPLLTAVIHSIAMCFHQLAVFFFPVVVLGLYFQTDALSSRERVLQIVKYSAMAFLITFGAYYVGYYWLTAGLDLGGFFRWVTSFSPDVGFNATFGDSLKHTLQGQVKLFLEGRFSFLKETLAPSVVVVIGALFIAAVGLLIEVIGLLRDRDRNKPEMPKNMYGRLFWLCVLWVGIYIIFLFFWLPHNTFYRIFYFPAFIVLIGIFVKRRSFDETRPLLVPLVVVVAALANFLFFVYPLSKVRVNTPLSMAIGFNSVWSEKTVVYYSEMQSDNMLMRYMNPATTWKAVDASDLEKLDNSIGQVNATGGEVWVDVSAFEVIRSHPTGEEWLDRHVNTEHEYRLIDKAYKVLFVKLQPADITTSQEKKEPR
jgi:hypothetical protein